MSTIGRTLSRALPALTIAMIAAVSGSAMSAEPVTKDEAVAMVQKAIAAIKSDGVEKVYVEIDDPAGKFVDRELYIVVYGLDGTVLAHGADKARIGTNQIGDKDADGKEFVKERVDLAKKEPSFWQNYKFRNPVTQKIAPKQMYCERVEETVVCGGIYQ